MTKHYEHEQRMSAAGVSPHTLFSTAAKFICH